MTDMTNSFVQQQMSTELTHHGVKGMKWGVRKDRQTTLSSNRGYSVSPNGAITIKKGHILQRMFEDGASDGSSGSAYFSFTEKDKKIYMGMMGSGAHSRFKFIRNLASGKVSRVTAAEELRSPSSEEAYNILNKTLLELGRKTHKAAQFDDDAKLWYADKSAKLMLKDDELSKAFKSNIQKAGYNMLLDETDASWLSDLPVIILDGEKSLSKPLVSDLGKAELEEARSFIKNNKEAKVITMEEIRNRGY